MNPDENPMAINGNGFTIRWDYPSAELPTVTASRQSPGGSSASARPVAVELLEEGRAHVMLPLGGSWHVVVLLEGDADCRASYVARVDQADS